MNFVFAVECRPRTYTLAYPMNQHAVVLALLSAALFGVSTPAAKALLGSIDPTVLAGLLYCGAGIRHCDPAARAGRTLIIAAGRGSGSSRFNARTCPGLQARSWLAELSALFS